MASTIDLSGLTLNPQEALQPSQAIFTAVYEKPELKAAHEVRTGIQMKTQIPIYGLLGLVGKADTGCGVNASTEQISTSQKYWEPTMVGFRLSHCQADVDQLYKMWAKDKVASKQWEQIPNPQVQFLSERIVDASLESQLRISAFGDTAADTFANGGVLTNGTDKTFFTMLDGLWKQIFTAVTAGSVTKVSIAENALASYAAQNSLAAARAYETLKAMYNGADPRLKKQKGRVFQVTSSLFENLEDYLEDKNLSNGFLERTEGGTNGLKYRGIPIMVRDDWDRNIAAYMDNGTTLDKPHRAILTVLGNIPIGTSDEESMKKVEMFYDRTLRTHYMDVDYMIDVKLLEEHLIVVAY